MGYDKIPYEIGKESTVLQYDRKSKKVVKIRRRLPGNVIIVHGVNDVGTSYKAIEDGLCEGLAKRLFRGFTPGVYRNPTDADKDMLLDDPDAVYYKRTTSTVTNSPVIPFYWGYRELDKKSRTANGQKTDRYGNRLDKDLSKGGGPYGNATSSLPDMWNKGIYAPADIGGDALRPLKTAPGRMYMILAARRLAALISMIRNYDEADVVTIVAHSQGCMLSLLAQAFLMDQNLRPADTLILTHPPYSLEDDGWAIKGANTLQGGEDRAMAPHYDGVNGTQTLHGRLQTLVNIVRGVVDQKSPGGKPDFGSLGLDEHGGMVEKQWKAEADRDNRNKVYLYFCPEDMTVALDNIKGIGWQGVPDLIKGTELKGEQEMVQDYATGKRRPMGPVRLFPREVTRQALRELGTGFYQRVFTARRRLDLATKKGGPVRVGMSPHDFALRLKEENDLAHVASDVRTLRASHPEAAWPIDTTNPLAEQRRGIRSITGEALRMPVLADVLGGQINPEDLPDSSSQAKLPAAKQGPWETVCPIDAAIAVSTEAGVIKWQEQRPDPSGRKRYPGTPQDLLRHEVVQMNDTYNKEKGVLDKSVDDQFLLFRAILHPDGKVMAHVRESPNAARKRWQHELSAKSFHGAIIGSSVNHCNVTAYDLAIGSGTAATDPKFYAYLCAVADWRLKKPLGKDLPRPGILGWNQFTAAFAVYLKSEPAWRMKLIEGNADYYSTGILPSCLPLLSGKLWEIVISETMGGTRVTNPKAKS